MLYIQDHPGNSISPLVVSFIGFNEDGTPIEEAPLRGALENALPDFGVKFTIEDMAYAIFPQIWWEKSNGNRNAFFEKFFELYPRHLAMHRHNNGRGMYFGRLIGARVKKDKPRKENQLNFIIEQFKNNSGARVSKFQATCFNPELDHTAAAQLGFPCLQQISFLPDNSNGKVSMNAFYATQELAKKGYANFLGLARLGAFMANEMGLEIERINIFVGKENLGQGVNQTGLALAPVIQAARDLFADEENGE